MQKDIQIEHLQVSDSEEARTLVIEYVKSLNIDLAFQDIETELQDFPGKYREPGGTFLVAKKEKKICGCVGLRKLDNGTCEMKRLFVADEFKGMGIGKGLVETIIREGKRKNYKKMRLDTLKVMEKAQNLYKSFGFYEISPYTYNPVEGAVYMEKILTD